MDHKQEMLPGQGQVPVMYYYPPEEEEINLVDLWRTLVRRQRLLWTVLFLATAASVALALSMPKKYFYRASVEIGTVPFNETLRQIEDPNTVLAKLKEAYIVKVLSDLANHQPGYKGLHLEARIPRRSQLIVIEGKGPEKDEAIYLGVIARVLDLLFKDHQRMIEIVRTELEANLQQQKSEIQALKDRKKVLAAELKRLDDLDALLREEIRQLKVRLATARARYAQISKVKDPATAMTMLLVDNQIQEDSQRLQTLQKELLLDQKNRRDTLKKQIADTEREIEVQKLKVLQAESNLKNMRMTQAIVPPMRSPEPVGPSRKIIVLLGVMLGLFAGVIAIFFAEFLDKVNRENEVNSAA